MNRFETRRIVPFTPEQMYALVADVERYPQFLPLCEGLRVRSRDTVGGQQVLVADMIMGYKAIRETIKSRVTLFPGEPRVEVRYLDGPFSHMENRWRFHEHARGCEVDFFIAYQLRNPLLGMLVGQLFERAFRKFAAAFEARAREVYGRGGASVTAG